VWPRAKPRAPPFPFPPLPGGLALPGPTRGAAALTRLFEAGRLGITVTVSCTVVALTKLVVTLKGLP